METEVFRGDVAVGAVCVVLVQGLAGEEAADGGGAFGGGGG